MTIFVVVFDEDSPKDAEATFNALMGIYKGNVYRYADYAYFVSTDEVSTEVRKRIGMVERGSLTGIVMALTHTYSGYTDPGLWEWLREKADK